MSGPANAIVGDQDEPMSIPETTVPEEILKEEQKLAKYSQSAEFKRLREFMEDRIKFFQKYLPGGQRVQDVPQEERAAYWQAACIVISEFEGVIAEYDRARQAVNES